MPPPCLPGCDSCTWCFTTPYRRSHLRTPALLLPYVRPARLYMPHLCNSWHLQHPTQAEIQPHHLCCMAACPLMVQGVCCMAACPLMVQGLCCMAACPLMVQGLCFVWLLLPPDGPGRATRLGSAHHAAVYAHGHPHMRGAGCQGADGPARG